MTWGTAFVSSDVRESAESGSAGLVLHVCTRYQRGGSERRVQDSIRALPFLRHHLLVGAESDVELARAQTGAERVEVLRSLVRPVAPRRDAEAVAALARLLRRGAYSLLVSHQSKAGVLSRAAATLAGDPPVVHSLSMADVGPGYGRLENMLFLLAERALARRTAAYCVVGTDLVDRFTALGVPRDRLHVVRSGIPLPGSLPSRSEARRRVDERHGTPAGRPLLTYVGSLEPRKNPLLLAGMLRQVHDRLPEAPHLLVVGDGPERARAAAEFASLGLGAHVTFTGHLPEARLVHEALRAADVTVLLSKAEGLPQVLVQSAAAGTPFVAFDVDGVRELLQLGATGTAVPLGCLEGASEAVTAWLGRRDTMDREPVADLSSWSPETIAADYRSVVGSVLRSVAPPRPARHARGRRGVPAGLTRFARTSGRNSGQAPGVEAFGHVRAEPRDVVPQEIGQPGSQVR